jgi:hypothetical protein
MLEWREVMNPIVLHLLECFELFTLSPLPADQQLVFHGEVNHEQRERVHAGQFSILKLFEDNLLQMLSQLKVVFPVAARHLGVEKLHECFGVNFANRTRVLVSQCYLIDVHNLAWLEL